MIKAIIFDFDGTIIDTETAWYYAFRDAYLEHGVELGVEQYSQCLGTSLQLFNPYEYLMTELGLPIDKEVFKARIRADHTARMDLEEVRDGVRDYLRQAKEAGLRIGLATSSDRAWIDKYMDRLGIRDYFEVIRCADDVSKVKPDPELYLSALEALGVRADEAVAIEDSPNGARAAVAAGMHCVIVPNTLTKLLSFDPSDRCYRMESLSDFEFGRLTAGAFV
ncbi:HAD family hydrolase [Paenibacillus sp. LHD-117]|uniref:HAD family hydrolase n=1 Tax=Paenibacillus sp. LHD-117 TaxID=3071412 RepID=UPI0027DF4FEF|nr:HAD family hydrolase [Paenibacillus sp. LHD-117]MDQ6423359.1 HAD family hydrolase [Paenibacillus sp. LHD-117]